MQQHKRPTLTLASGGLLKKLGAGNVVAAAAAASVHKTPKGRIEYLMTPDEFKAFKEACTEIPIAVAGDPNSAKRRAQQRAREFWKTMGERYSFDPTSSEPVPGKHFGYFTAVPIEPPADDVTDAVIKDRRSGLELIEASLKAENPNWSADRVKAEAKQKWHDENDRTFGPPDTTIEPMQSQADAEEPEPPQAA